MSLHTLRQQSWLRTALAVLLLCFVLDAAAHAGHSHEQKGNTHSVCDYCATLGSLVDAPIHITPATHAPAFGELVVAFATAFIATRPVSVAQARAPPISC